MTDKKNPSKSRIADSLGAPEVDKLKKQYANIVDEMRRMSELLKNEPEAEPKAEDDSDEKKTPEKQD